MQSSRWLSRQTNRLCSKPLIFRASSIGWARFNAHPFFGFIFRFSSPVRRLDQPQASGGLGEHCSSPAVGHGVCAPPGRVAQPRLLAADRGYPAGAANRGRLFFGYFILAKQKKVTSCRSTTGGFSFSLYTPQSARRLAATLRQAQGER